MRAKDLSQEQKEEILNHLDCRIRAIKRTDRSDDDKIEAIHQASQEAFKDIEFDDLELSDIGLKEECEEI